MSNPRVCRIDGRHVGERRRFSPAADGERAQLTGAKIGLHRDHHREIQLDFTAHLRGHLAACAFVGNVGELHARDLLKQYACKMAGGAVAARRIVEPAFRRARQRDELFHGAHRDRGCIVSTTGEEAICVIGTRSLRASNGNLG